MGRYGLVLLVAVGGIWLVGAILFYSIQALSEIGRALRRSIHGSIQAVQNQWRQRQLEKEHRRKEAERIAYENVKRAEAEEIESYRSRNPVRVIISGLSALQAISRPLDEFISAANSFRPIFDVNVDTRFRSARYVPIPFDLPLNFHPAAIRASAVDTPFGAV